MMTEEQLIDRICLTCVDVRHAATEESAQKFINDIRGLAEQLAALTQPTSPALKLPETISVRTAIAALDNASAVTTIAQSYKMAWNSCIAETKRLNAPHTAPIEPICATGGAEWVKEAERLAEMHGISFVVFRHGEQPKCADPTKVVISFTDNGLGYEKAATEVE